MSGSIGGGWQSRGSPGHKSEKPSGQRSTHGDPANAEPAAYLTSAFVLVRGSRLVAGGCMT
jgi:hypothetical protein